MSSNTNHGSMIVPPESVSSAPLPFGRNFTSHMFTLEYKNGGWGKPEIECFSELKIHPSIHGLNYGVSVIDGLKAYKTIGGDRVLVFRLADHAARLNRSAQRYGIPEVPWELFREGVRELVEIDRAEIPNQDRGFLYLRPVLFSTDQQIGVKVPESFKLLVMGSPSGEFFAKPIRALLVEDLSRAWPGGTGDVKSSANYGCAVLAQKRAAEQDCDTVLWLDGQSHKWIEECGTMNIFFAFEDHVVTPPLSGTILPGITRDSILTILREKGINCKEERISAQQLIASILSGRLREAFGAGTAATVIAIDQIRIDSDVIQLPTLTKGRWWKEIGDELRGVMCGRIPDKWHWTENI